MAIASVERSPAVHPAPTARARAAPGEMFQSGLRSWSTSAVWYPVTIPVTVLRVRMTSQGGCGIPVGSKALIPSALVEDDGLLQPGHELLLGLPGEDLSVQEEGGGAPYSQLLGFSLLEGHPVGVGLVLEALTERGRVQPGFPGGPIEGFGVEGEAPDGEPVQRVVELVELSLGPGRTRKPGLLPGTPGPGRGSGGTRTGELRR